MTHTLIPSPTPDIFPHSIAVSLVHHHGGRMVELQAVKYFTIHSEEEVESVNERALDLVAKLNGGDLYDFAKHLQRISMSTRYLIEFIALNSEQELDWNLEALGIEPLPAKKATS